MHTHRTTVNLNTELLEAAKQRNPGRTTTALLEEGLRALLARDAARHLAALGGTAPKARGPKRHASSAR